MFEKYAIIANTRNEFESIVDSEISYNDHPSLQSIEYTIEELQKIGYNISYFGGVESLIDIYNSKTSFHDTLFINFSDGLEEPNRKGQASMLLEMLGVPFTGSDVTARLMAGNKAFAKSLLRDKLSTPPWIHVFDGDSINNLHISDYPVVVKPNREGSSVGINQNSICHTPEELKIILSNCLEYYKDIIIEKYVPGYEITCFLIGNKDEYILCEPLSVMYGDVAFFDDYIFGSSEKANHIRNELPASEILEADIVKSIKKSTQIAFEELHMRDYARADFRYNKKDGIQFIEINGNPVISPTSEIGVISKYTQKPYGEIVSSVITAAENRINRG